jgi:arginase
MDSAKQKTLRLLMPQWQGGDYDLSIPTRQLYPLGARILAFLAPESDAPLVEVPVEAYTGAPRTKQNGVVQQDVVLGQLRAARKIIDQHAPDRIIMFGGDCLVNQAPFSYLNERYHGKFGVLWLDAHPDVSTPQIHDREHAMVLGNLMGGGDPVFAQEVKMPLKANQVLIVGVDGYNDPREEIIIKNIGLPVLHLKGVAENSGGILRWIRDNKFDHVAIHLDLDVLDPKFFYSQFSNDPVATKKSNATLGKLTIPQVSRIINDVSGAADVVGFGITEHMPWDASNLKNMMEQFSFMK